MSQNIATVRRGGVFVWGEIAVICDINDLAEGAVARGDVCVIGTGPAGMEVIRYLRRQGLDVVVAEGGRRDFSKDMQALTRIENVGRSVREPDPDCQLTPYLAPEHRGEGRLRQLGGNSNIWTGKWREFEAHDFEARPHVPHSGWPFGLDELLPLYREIQRDYGFADFDALTEMARPFQNHEAGRRLALTFHYWDAEPLRTARRHAAALEEDGGIRVILGTNAVELTQASGGGSVKALRCRAPEGREITIEAGDFVIASGGIEVPRLLLASTGHDAAGIGNAHGLVGRFFQEHPKIKTGIFHPGPNFHLLPGGAANFPRPRFKACLSLPAEIQARHGLLNHTLHFAPRPARSAGLFGRLRRMARPAPATTGPFKAAFIVEQAPDPDSRVTLSDRRDPLGMRQPRLDWRLNDLDAESFTTTLAVLGEELARAGIGRLDFPGAAPTIADTVDCRHHMGTARMAATPETGVVDPDARVWGVDNLYVASSAVFPTGHSYGPTLTIVALARKAARAIVARRLGATAAVA